MPISVYRVGIKARTYIIGYFNTMKNLYIGPQCNMYQHISTALMIINNIKIIGFYGFTVYT